MRPPDAARDWRQRLERLRSELDEIDKRHTSTMSATAIRAQRDRLLAFFVTAYHLKDALRIETTIDAATIEGAISADRDLALLADLANVDKHGTLNRSPRSGYVPAVLDAVGEQSGDGGDGWRLVVTIAHGPDTRNGITCARSALSAWQRLLTEWELL